MPDLLIDNQTYRLSEAINTIVPHASVARFAVGYFFLSGFNAIADKIGELEKVYLLIGTTTNRETLEQLALGYRRRELVEEKLRSQRYSAVDKAISDTVADIRQNISGLQPGERDEQTIVTLADLISRDKVEVRVFTRGVLHAKAYVFDYRNPQPNSKGVGIVGSSNLTEPGLTSNTELNVQVDDDANILTGEGLHRDLCEWFDALWTESKPFSVELMQELQQSWAMAIASPYDVYMKMLFESVRAQIERDGSALVLPDDIELAAYQKVAVEQAIGMVNQYGGAFVADVVGVGKSFVGAAAARFYYESERRRPLIICPRPLVEMWEGYNRRWHLNAEIMPMSMLRERQGSQENGTGSTLDEDRYQDARFVLIDESHNFRHSDNQRYRVLNDYLLEGGDRKVLLLTATPYNKSPMDLYNQIKLFHHEETTRIPVEPRNLRQYFSRVEDGERRLSDLLVHLMVRRTRWQLLRWYGYDEETDRPVDPYDFEPYLDEERRAYLKFTDRYGVVDKKFFPSRDLESLEYCIDDVYGEVHGHSLYEEIVRLLHRRKGSGESDDAEEDRVEEADERALTYARYGLWHHLKPEWRQDAKYGRLVRAGMNLRGLIRTSLFKRLESSVEAFRRSVRRQITVHRNFITALDNGRIAAGEKAADLLELDRDDTEEALELFLEALESADETRGFEYEVSAFNVEDLRADVDHDRQTFEVILEMVSEEKIPPEQDAKLQRFLAELPGLLTGKKLLVFTQYRDTAEYLMKHLPADTRGRVALATGETENLTRIVGRFSPVANGYELGKQERELDLIISTDVLSEGLNLQDCNQVLNYDLHWNPVRLIQRFGRVDRIGSEHDRVIGMNFLPEKAAERELELKEKLEARIQEFNEILGMDAQVLDQNEKVNREAVYAIYEERSGKHLGRFEASEANLLGVTLAEAEEFFRELRDRDPPEYERIRNLRDGIRSARATGDGKVLVMCRAGEFIRLYVRDLSDQSVDLDTIDALNLLQCEKDEPTAELPANLGRILSTVKLTLDNEVDELWNQRRTRSRLTVGQRYVLDELEKLRRARPHLDADGGLSRLAEATSQTRQKRFQRACDRIRRDKVIDDALLRRVRQLYYDCALHLETAAVREEEIEARIPRIVAVAALV